MTKTRDIQPYHLATVAAVLAGNQPVPMRPLKAQSPFDFLPAAHALIMAAGDLLQKAREYEAARNAEKKEKAPVPSAGAPAGVEVTV